MVIDLGGGEEEGGREAVPKSTFFPVRGGGSDLKVAYTQRGTADEICFLQMEASKREG